MVCHGDHFHGAKNGVKRAPKFLELIAEIRVKSRPIFTPGAGAHEAPQAPSARAESLK